MFIRERIDYHHGIFLVLLFRYFFKLNFTIFYLTTFSDNPLSYSLYLAEENLEYDTELPPQDRHRLVLECGFPVLALVKNSDVLQNQRFLVNVYVIFFTFFEFLYLGIFIIFRYFVNGKCSTFELETLDIPLKWIFDQALQRRKQESSDIQKRRNFAFKGL